MEPLTVSESGIEGAFVLITLGLMGSHPLQMDVLQTFHLISLPLVTPTMTSLRLPTDMDHCMPVNLK